MKINQYPVGKSDVCGESSKTVADILRLFELVEIVDSDGLKMSSKVTSALYPVLVAAGWKQRFPIDNSVGHDDYESFFIDYFLDENSETCGHKHRYLLQFMFDNRQAIGTNLLKFDIAAKNSSEHNRVVTNIGICVEKSVIRKLGWDYSAASAQEYINAIVGPYKKVLNNPPLVLAIEKLH